ncbi:GDSL-type esterase/lipase family protein [Actinoallomurus sp. NPDC052274]|uniref:GDSL-type esterase/lipase family protein n=1 Tax=Actinoallomurus sp. NPDC052274 TaxID=3155420 RepID=UPI00341BB435
MRVVGATLLPMKGSDHYGRRSEADRERVNDWIRTSGAFDAVADFDRALADPSDPLAIRAAYDSGDHLHPNDAGYRAMAQAIDPDRL